MELDIVNKSNIYIFKVTLFYLGPGLPSGAVVNNSSTNAGDARDVSLIFPGSETSPGEEMAAHSSIPAWQIPWTGEPSKLQSMGSQNQTWLSARAHTHTHTQSRLLCGTIDLHVVYTYERETRNLTLGKLILVTICTFACNLEITDELCLLI